MSVNYQADSYILYNESICNNQLKHQELLVSTLKQLAEENKRLLKEREQFEKERLERKLEINILKQNFINLLTVGQYEFNKSKFMKHEFVDENKFHEIISKRREVNHHNLKNLNFVQEIKLKSLHQLIKNNCKDLDYLNNYTNAFDCRPYKGPKTPPTPSSKYRNNSSYLNARNQEMNNFGPKSVSRWSLIDMLYYLKKYKELFQIYRKSMDLANFQETNKIDQYQINYNLYEPVVFDQCRHDNEKIVSNDLQFYQELIEKHKKSLEMIENVGYKIYPNADLSKVRKPQLNSVSKDYHANNNTRNHISNDFNSQSKLKNTPVLSDQTYSKTNETLSNRLKDNFIVHAAPNLPLNDSIFEKHNVNMIVDNDSKTNNDIQKMLNFHEKELLKLDSEKEIVNCPNKSEGIDSQNIFEDGEIIDSCDESNDKKIVKLKTQNVIARKKIESEHKIKKPNILKHVIPSILKRSVQDYSKSRYNTSSFFARYQKSWKTDKLKFNKPGKRMDPKINEKANLKREESHSYYQIDDRRIMEYHKSNQGSTSRKDIRNNQHSYRYFSNIRHYSPQY